MSWLGFGIGLLIFMFGMEISSIKRAIDGTNSSLSDMKGELSDIQKLLSEIKDDLKRK
jgi:hypothetical protein